MAVKRLAGFRFVEVEQDDTLQRIAARELGDAALWTELIAINDLAPPYLTGDVTLAGPKVRLYGQSLIVPATTAAAASEADQDRVFGTDIRLNKGRLEVSPSGDLALVAGVENLNQALKRRVSIPLRELLFHQDYGCGVHDVKGRGGQTGTATLAAQYVRAAMAADPRVQSVESPKATLTGDAVEATATVVTVNGSSVDFQIAV